MAGCRRLFRPKGWSIWVRSNNFGSLKPESFDAFLYTSAYDGLPNVVLEAMGHSLPVIAPDVGGVREAVVSSKTGWLIPAVGGGDDVLVAAYVDAIVELYENWERSQAMGGQAAI